MDTPGNNLLFNIAKLAADEERENPKEEHLLEYKNYFFNDYSTFRYQFHRENKRTYLKNYIESVNEFVEDRKTEFYFNLNHFNFVSSEDGQIYFQTNEGYIGMMLKDEKYVNVIQERRDGFILYEKPWDEIKRSLDSKVVFGKEHPALITESLFNHPNFFSYKHDMIVSWDKSLIYFYNLFTKMHAKPFAHKFNIMGLTLAKFEVVILFDKATQQLVWFNVFEQQKLRTIDCNCYTPCRLELQGSTLYMDTSIQRSEHGGNQSNLKRMFLFNTATYKLALKLDGKSINLSRKKPIYYSISPKGTLLIKNYMTGQLVDEIKNDFTLEDIWLTHEEKELFMIARINHPVQSWVKIVNYEIKRKRIKFEYELKYNATNFFINYTRSKILHWNRDAKTITLEELSIDHNEIIYEFDRPMEKFDLENDVVYFFHDKYLYKQILSTYEKKPVLNRGNHNFQIRGKYYFVYSKYILAIFDKEDKCLFDNFIGLNKRINKLAEENSSQIFEEKIEDHENDKKTQNEANPDQFVSVESPHLVESEYDESYPSDEKSDKFYENLYAKNHKHKNNQISSLRRMMNDSLVERDIRDKTFRIDPADNHNKSMIDFQNQKLLSQINLIYFLDFVDGDPSAFYLINLRNYQILIFQYVQLTDEPEIIYLESEIHGGRVTSDRKLMYALISDGKIKLWNLRNREKIRTYSITGKAIELSNDEQKLFVLNEDGHLYIVESESDKVIHRILINPNGIQLTFSNFMVQENPKNPNELFILYNKKIKCHLLLPRINVWEYQCINSFFKPRKVIKADEFDANIVKYREIYQQSIVLPEYFNPIYIASLYSISSSLQLILSKNSFKYPNESNLQIKPLLLALYNKDLDIAEILCEHLIYSKEQVYYSYEEMCLLLQMDYPFTKDALIKSIQQINPIEYDSDVYEWPDKLEKKIMICFQMDKTFNLKSLQHIKNISDSTLKDIWTKIPKLFTKSVTEEQNRLIMAKTVELKVSQEQNNSRILNTSKTSAKSVKSIKIVKNLSQDLQNLFTYATSKQINYFLITGQFNFHDGSEDSRFFLRNYFKSKQTNFILSKFRFIIVDKWERLNYLYKMEALFFICLTVSLTLTLFIPESLVFFITTIVLLTMYAGYETLSYTIEPHDYFKNKDNLLDIFAIIAGLTMTIITRVFLNGDWYNENVLNLFHIITLFVFYFRCTTYLKAFETLNPIVTMIYTVAFDIWDIILVLIVLIVGFSLLFLKAQSEQEVSKNFGQLLSLNYFSFFGDVDMSVVDDNNYVSWTVLIFATLFITFIMSNFIIARMSNNYDRMEQRQIEVTLKEKARLILEFETFLNIFPSYRQKMRNLYRKKYYTLVANDTNVDEDFDQMIENKFKNKNSIVDSIIEFNENMVEELGALSQRIENIDEKHKSIIQDLNKYKKAM